MSRGMNDSIEHESEQMLDFGAFRQGLTIREGQKGENCVSVGRVVAGRFKV
jgi:hypothetical protein